MPILKFFPYESFCIVSKLEPDVLQVRLQNEITFNDKGFYRNADKFFDPDTHFLGFAGKYKFNIKPYVNYSNWLLPKITGTINGDGTGGSLVMVKMKLPAMVTLFISVCMVVVILACASVIALSIRIITFKGVGHFISTFNYIMLIPFVVLVLGHFLTTGAFKQESRKARAILLEMFEGQLQSY
jgi:ABC-type glycerol-3-phosphate transport system permease component